MEKRYIRKNKKMLGIYLDITIYELITARAQLHNIDLSSWVRRAIFERLEKENKYL